MSSMHTEPATHPARSLMRRPMVPIAVITSFLVVGSLAWKYTRDQRASAPTVQSAVIAIAPFRTLGTGIEPWSGLGLAEQIRRALDAMPGVSVQVESSKTSRPADYMLGGTVGRGGARSEIGVELIRVRDRAVVWTGTFWRTSADLPAFAGELADAVVEAVRLDEKRAILARESPR